MTFMACTAADAGARPEPEGGEILGNRAESQELICLGSRIRERRLSAGLSQEALAEKAGVSPNTVSRIEGGLTEMYVETFRKLVHALGADAGGLLCREEQPDKRGQACRGHFKAHEAHGRSGAGSCGTDRTCPGGCSGKEQAEVKTSLFQHAWCGIPPHPPGKTPRG